MTTSDRLGTKKWVSGIKSIHIQGRNTNSFSYLMIKKKCTTAKNPFLLGTSKTKNLGLEPRSPSIIYDDSDEAFLLSLINSEAVKKNIIMSRIFLRAFLMHHLDCCIIKVPQINIIQMQKNKCGLLSVRLREEKLKYCFLFLKLNITYLSR